LLSENLYLAGPAGLSVYAPDGTLRSVLRTGRELPVAPIVAVTSARLRGVAETRILMATSGAGLLLLTPSPRGAPTLQHLVPASADARDLTALLPLPSGDLLLGTRRAGLLLFDGASLTSFAAAASARDITSLAAVDAASILIGTRNAGLFYLHAGTLRHSDTSSGLPDNQVESLAVANGRAFVGTPLGVAQFDLASSDTAFRPTRILAPGLFAHALAATPTDLLVGTLDQGIQAIPFNAHPHLRSIALASQEASGGERVDSFFAINDEGDNYALADGALLAHEGALLAHEGASWHPALPPRPPALADRNISALAFAPDGTLYVGFFDHGLDTIATSGQIRHLEDDHLFCVNRLLLDPARHTMAAATANGLVLFDRQHAPRQVLSRRDGLLSDHVTDLAFTRAGLTLATPAGLTFMTATGAESLYAFQGLVNNHVYTLGQQGDRLLAGTLGGISLLEAGTVRRNFTAANSGLRHNWITALAPNPRGGWLIGTYGAGLETLSADGSRFSAIDLPTDAPRDLVINPNALLVTGAHVYAGTLGHGLLVYNQSFGRWSVVTHGLPSLNVTAFAESNGELYVGTENGLVRIAEARLP
jgi:ligand-binding sensor domain-containing protein